MNPLFRPVILGVLLGFAVLRPAAQAAEPVRKKVIYYGFSTRDTAYARAHWQEMEKLPFDGIAISVALSRTRPTIGDGSTGNLLGWQLFGTRAFRLESFRGAIEELRAPAWSRFTDNFLPASIATRDQDAGLNWFDDRRWQTIVNNWRVAVAIARAGRCKGLLLDVEHYDYECELFNFAHHRAQRANRPFADYLAIARRRGRDLMKAARTTYPGVTIACLYGYTLALDELRRGKTPETSRYALLPAFFDGMLEEAKTERFIDLYEFSVGYKTDAEFAAGYQAVRHDAVATSAQPARYRALVEAGFSLALDYRSNLHPWNAADPSRHYFSPAEFQTALQAALRQSDEYVWIYSEDDPRFFPRENLPDSYLEAIAAARAGGQPSAAARR